MTIGRLLRFHEDAAVIAWWMRTFGRVLAWFTPPARRRAVLAALAIPIGAVMTAQAVMAHAGAPFPSRGSDVAMVVLAQFLLLWLVYRAAVAHARLPAPLRRHPQWALHGSYGLVLGVLWLTSPDAGPWRQVLAGLAVVYPMLLWRMGYLLLAGQHGRMAGTGMRDHLVYLWPAYGGSETPYGKGLAYLSQCEARTTQALARSQLAGIRLLLLALAWRLLLTLYEGVFYGAGNRLTAATGGFTLGMPELRTLLALGAQAPWFASWVSIYADLVSDVLRLAIKGHLIVGFLRLYGFNVFRNTYKPLLAESVVEFWNRYFYYFKELLVTFFFMPTFTGAARRLRRWPRVRLLAAVFSAACVGNAYYHLIEHGAELARGELFQVLAAQSSRMFYCLLLAGGIFVSMLREQARRGAAPAVRPWRRVLRIAGVWTFFGLISIWNTKGGVAFWTRIEFFLGLLGLA